LLHYGSDLLKIIAIIVVVAVVVIIMLLLCCTWYVAGRSRSFSLWFVYENVQRRTGPWFS